MDRRDRNRLTCNSTTGGMTKLARPGCIRSSRAFLASDFVSRSLTILVDKMRIPMGDIVKVEAPGEIFETRWEDQSAD